MTPDPLHAQPGTRRLDGLLAIGPHPLDAQLRALRAYAASIGHSLDLLWALLPGENPATDAPDSRFPLVVFDDEVAGFTAEERGRSAAAGEAEDGTTDWHVAHATPQPKRPTLHLPVYGCPADGETAADAVLCVGTESLDRQLARIEAYGVRSAARLRGVYIATHPGNVRMLLRDFSACNRGLSTGVVLTVGPRGEIEVHG